MQHTITAHSHLNSDVLQSHVHKALQIILIGAQMQTLESNYCFILVSECLYTDLYENLYCNYSIFVTDLR